MYILWCIELPKKIWEKNFNNADIDIPSLTHFALLDEIWQKNLKSMQTVIQWPQNHMGLNQQHIKKLNYKSVQDLP